MARVDAVIGYQIGGITESDVLEGREPSPEFIANKPVLEAQVVAKVKQVAGIVILGASQESWPEASVCTATTFGFPAAPDAFEIASEIDGAHIFGRNAEDDWTYLPGKNGLPGLLVPTEGLSIEDIEGEFITQSAERWGQEGITPEGVLALSGLGLKLRLDDVESGLPALSTVRRIRPGASEDALTVGIMLKFASGRYDDMWLGESESVEALRSIATSLRRSDSGIEAAVEQAVANV